ncbi:hypothetical protein CSUI_000334, partial [Cystoisospora suis]
MKPEGGYLPSPSRRLGPGIQLYFDFLWQLFFVFLFMAVLSVPQLVANSAGNMIEGSGVFGWEKTFLGNLGTRPLVLSEDRAQRMEELRARPVRLYCDSEDCNTGIRDWTTAFSVLDAIGVLIVHVPRVLKGEPTGIERFSVEVSRLPKKLNTTERGYEEALASHFGKLVAGKLRDRDSSVESSPGQPIEAEDLASADRVTAEKGVADVAVIYDLGQKMRLLQKTAATEKELALLGARKREGMKVSESREKKVHQKLKRDTQRLRESLPPPDERAPVVAMVTFTSTRIRELILIFHAQGAPLREGEDSPDRRPQSGGHTLRELGLSSKTTKAPHGGSLVAIFLLRRFAARETSGGMWQFTPAWQLSFSRPEGSQDSEATLTVCNVGLCTEKSCAGRLSPTVGTPLFNEASPMTFETSPPATLNCPPQEGARSATLLRGDGVALAWRFDGSVTAHAFQLSYAASALVVAQVSFCLPLTAAGSTAVCTLVASKQLQPGQNFVSLSIEQPIASPECGNCSIGNLNPKEFLDFVTQYSAQSQNSPHAGSIDPYLNCYCQARLTSLRTDKNLLHACSPVLYKHYLAYVLMIVSAMVVAATNIVLKFTLRMLVSWSRPTSVSSQLTATLIWIFVATAINTGLLNWLLQVRMWGRGAWMLGTLDVVGKFTDFSFDWYLDVGSALVINALVLCFSPFVIQDVLLAPLTCLKRWWLRKKRPVQLDLNTLYTNIEFGTETRYAHILTLTFVCLAYSSGLPVLLLVAALGTMVLYLCSRIALFRTVRRPLPFSSAMNDAVLALLPNACVLHALAGFFMLGQPLVSPGYILFDTQPSLWHKWVETMLLDPLEDEGMLNGNLTLPLRLRACSSTAILQLLILVGSGALLVLSFLRVIYRG